MNSKDIIFQSTYDNINAFIKGKKLNDLVGIYLYIMGSDSLNRPPTKIEKMFIGEFFTHDAWAEYIQNRKRPNKSFIHIPPFDIQTISGILAFEIMKIAEVEVAQISKLKSKADRLQNSKNKLKKDLKSAIDDSYEEDGIFYKDNGWCNISDVLVNHNLITLKEE